MFIFVTQICAPTCNNVTQGTDLRKTPSPPYLINLDSFDPAELKHPSVQFPIRCLRQSLFIVCFHSTLWQRWLIWWNRVIISANKLSHCWTKFILILFAKHNICSATCFASGCFLQYVLQNQFYSTQMFRTNCKESKSKKFYDRWLLLNTHLAIPAPIPVWIGKSTAMFLLLFLGFYIKA